MEIFHVRYFVAVAENLSFSRAARQLHMATSPLSQRVRDLERELGVSLFDRDSHNVRLTDHGSALLPIAKDVLGRFDDIPWRLQREAGKERRTVFCGLAPGLHPRLRERLKELDERCWPDYEIKRWPGGSSDLVTAVQRGELAMACAHLPVHAEGIEVRSLMSEPLGAVVPTAEFGGRESVSLSELTEHSYVRPAPGMVPTYFDQIEIRLSAAGIKKRIDLNTGDYGSISEIVANGSAFGISMLDPESSMRKYHTDGTTILPFNEFAPALETGLIWRRDRADEGADLHTLVAAAQDALSPADS